MALRSAPLIDVEVGPIRMFWQIEDGSVEVNTIVHRELFDFKREAF